MPGIIGDRFFKMFDANKDGLISESAFTDNIIKVFMSDLDTKLRFTFDM